MKIPWAIFRGGTSKPIFFSGKDLMDGFVHVPDKALPG